MVNKISTHAKNRYAERIMDKTEKLDINMFILKNEQKIHDDIDKMIEYGELIYTGKPLNTTKNTNHVSIYIKDLWVIILDNKTKDCITLYRIDLGLDEDFNKSFVDKMLDKINVAKDYILECKSDIDLKCSNYKSMISVNEEEIKKYEGYIKTLRSLNIDYADVIDNIQKTNSIAEDKVRSLIKNLIGKKEF